MVYSPGKLSGPCNHIRISRLIDNRKISGEFKGRILYYLLHGLVRFAVLNYKMLIATENTTKSKPKKKSTSKKTTTKNNK